MYFEQQQEKIILYCEKCMDNKNIIDQYHILMEVLRLKKNIQIEAGLLNKIDTAGLQLLLNFILNAEKNHIEFQWTSVSYELLELAKLLRISALLKCQDKESS